MDDRAYKEGARIIVWFARMRWLSILFITYVVLHLKFISRLDFPLATCLLIIVAGSAYNLAFPFFTRFFKSFRDLTFYIYLMGTIDLLFATVLIHYTGGINSPLVFLYFMLLIAGSIFGFTFLDYVLTCQLTIFFLISCLLEAMNIIPHYSALQPANQLSYGFDQLSATAAALLLTGLLITYMTSFLSKTLRGKQQEIEGLSNARFDFMNVVMHEAKSPLTSILGYLELISSQKLGPIAAGQKEPLEIIRRSSQRILNMINDLLDLTRLELGKVKLELKPINLRDLAGHVIEEFRPALDERRIQLIEEFDLHTPPVKADEDKLHEVLTNLLSNALKFSNDDGRIFFSIAPFENGATVSVRDEGLGIAPEDLPHIFEKFYRANKESAERKGTGLGLPICRQIIEMLGGRIWAVSAGRGQGAVFYFTLPG